MKIYNSIGSKKRLIEMFENVNKISLNENTEKINPIIFGFEQLKNNTLNIEKTQTRVDDDETYVVINANDSDGNKYMFVFMVRVDDMPQNNVYDVDSVSLTDFNYNGNGVSDDKITDFNNQYGSIIYDVISEYMDVDDDSLISDDEVLNEIGKNVDKVLVENVVSRDDNLVNKTLNRYGSELTTEKKEELIRKAILLLFEKNMIKPQEFGTPKFINLVKNVAGKIYEDYLKSMNEDEYPSKLGKEFKTSSKYPKAKKERPKKVKISEFDDETSVESKIDSIDDLAQSKQACGDEIEGGLGDNKSLLEFDPEQIKLGMGVELEHTDDPLIALEITLDHLTEDPQYYTIKDSPEASAQFQASTDASNVVNGSQDGMAGELDGNGNPIPAIDPSFGKRFSKQDSNDDIENILLGYKPKNVGELNDD